MCESKESLEASLAGIVSSLDPDSMHGIHAKSLVSYFSRIERLAVAGKTLCARRVATTGVYELDGHRDPSSWLAAETGESLGSAVSILRTAENIADLREIEDAFRSGELSGTQARELTETAKLDPSCQKELLDLAKDEDLIALKRACERLKATHRREQDEQAREAAVHENRSLRTFIDADGAFRLDARLSKSSGARILAALKSEARKVFDDARRSGVTESSRAYLADGLVNLVCGGSDQSQKALCHLRVDLAALKRGSLGQGEMCELEGIGPISIATATDLLGDSVAKLLVTSANDVHSVFNLGRYIPAKVYSALLERDPCCVVPGCSSTRNLETDHREIPFIKGGPVNLANCCRVCRYHHQLKTHRGYALEGEPGAWVWVHPDGTRQTGRARESEPEEPDRDSDAGERAGAGDSHSAGDSRPPPGSVNLFDGPPDIAASETARSETARSETAASETATSQSALF